MASSNTDIYGAARQMLYKYSDGVWKELCNIELGNDFRDMVIFDKFAVIASGLSSDGPGRNSGIEVIDLETMDTTYYTFPDIPLPSDSVFSLEVQDLGDETYRLWIGTFEGVAFCTIQL